MGKFLRVLVVIFFLLSIAALVLGMLLFNKRELVKQRTLQLETYIRKLALTIEADDVPKQTVPYLARDDSGVTAAEADRFETQPDLIQRSTFWDAYEAHLEKAQNPTIVFTDDMTRQLQQFYFIDPETGKTMRDAQGYKRTTGAGTMINLLEQVLEKATRQQGRLDATRQMLRLTREELVDTIERFNTRVRDLRRANQTVRQHEGTIAQLRGELAQLRNQVQQLERTVRDKDDEIARINQELDEKQKTIDDQVEEIESLDRQNKTLLGELESIRSTPGRDPVVGPRRIDRDAVTFNPGLKGTVRAVDSEFNFVLVQLSDDFATELRAAYSPEAGGMPAVEMLVTRKDSQEFVTKIKMVQLRQGNLAVCNIIPEWQQLPVEAGDNVSVQ